MEEITPVWSLALWATLILVSIIFLFQVITRRSLIERSFELAEISENNRKLSKQIELLHKEIATLNIELKRIAIENKQLNEEVVYLSNEVNRIHLSIGAKK